MKLIRNRQTLFLSVIWVAVVLVAQTAGGEESSAGSTTNRLPLFQLRAAIQVDGAGVFLDQLVAGAQELPHLRLCNAPQFGKSAALNRTDVADLARAAGWERSLTNWSGVLVARVTRRSRVLDEKETLGLLTSLLKKEFVKEGELELHLSQRLPAINVPDEPFVIKVLDLPTSGVSSAFIVRFEIQTSFGETVGSWQAPLQAQVWHDVWAAASALKRGDPLRGADLIRQRRDMLLCEEPLAQFSPDDPSLEFVSAVQPGSPIWARLVRPKAVVHRGQSLAAMVQDGALQITLKVEALEDGAAGQVIRIRNPLSRRDLRAKVLDEQNVLVLL